MNMCSSSFLFSGSLPNHVLRPLLCPSLLLALLLQCLCVAFATPVAAVDEADEFRLRLVQVVHRHGARAPELNWFIPGNESLICSDVPCGLLNVPGQTQLYKVGSFLARRYRGTTDDTETIATDFLPPVYNETIVYTRSTDVPRTLQSAAAFLHGLFTGANPTGPIYPVIHTVSTGSDTLLLPWSDASFTIDLNMIRHRETLRQTEGLVDGLFPTHESILAMAREVYSEGRCADYASRVGCVNQLADIAASYMANGLLPSHGALQEGFPALLQVSAAIFAGDYAYHPESDERQRGSGSLGQTLVNQLIQNMESTISGKSNYKMFHYSGHDGTLNGLAATLGDNNNNASFGAPFGATYVFELLERMSDFKMFVRVLRGASRQTPESAYEFGWWPFPMRCTNRDGAVYLMNSTNQNANLCPLDDFVRFVRSAKGSSPLGSCYLTDSLRDRMNCTGDGASSSYCETYRNLCPAYACGSGAVLDAASKTCKAIAIKSSGSPSNAEGSDGSPVRCGTDLSGGAVAGIAIATFVIGLMIAAIFALLLYCFVCEGNVFLFLYFDLWG